MDGRIPKNTQSGTSESGDQTLKRRDGVLVAFRELLKIIRDFGMPTAAFGAGIYAFILVLQVQIAPELKAAVAFVLTLLGLLAQLWVYSRENPRIQGDEVKEQLRRMTDLVERLVEMNLNKKREGG